MSSRPLVLLFDIDGTLLTTGGVGMRALARAFEELYGRPDAMSGFRLDGMTDGVIIRQALTAIGQPASSESVEAVLERYLSVLGEEISRASDSAYYLHPGMLEALAAAEQRPQTAVGLGTGNVRAGARLKLERVNVFHRFAFGGFGCDHDDRAELIRAGAVRGASALGAPLSECRVVVIGDTPKDVAAAKAIGAECVGVGTGRFTPEELLAAGAEHAFPSLASPGALESLLGRTRATGAGPVE